MEDSMPIRALRKGTISTASGGSAPSTPAWALHWTVGGLAVPPRPQAVWALTQLLRACGAPSFPPIKCKTRKIHHTCPSSQNAQYPPLRFPIGLIKFHRLLGLENGSRFLASLISCRLLSKNRVFLGKIFFGFFLGNLAWFFNKLAFFP